MYYSAFIGCRQERDNEWHITTSADGTQQAEWYACTVFRPFHSMWTGGNHWDTNCLTEDELSSFRSFAHSVGLPQPIVNESFDAYQMDFFSRGVEYKTMLNAYGRAFTLTDGRNLKEPYPCPV